jgi:hypothetical protein
MKKGGQGDPQPNPSGMQKEISLPSPKPTRPSEPRPMKEKGNRITRKKRMRRTWRMGTSEERWS